ncbi:MAG: DUF2156 domain-containing protein [Spirochaetaceae bacterium]|nr:DUF2156 domain-containing protein [Spirochaetaceae bacterium]
MNALPDFPDFKPISMDMSDYLLPFCRGLNSGISEFTFANFFLDSLKYNYKISRLSHNSMVIIGNGPSRKLAEKDLGSIFFSVLGDIPQKEQLDYLFINFCYWKNMPQDLEKKTTQLLSSDSFQIIEDRDNFDYIYLRENLASLSGKALHKKKNLVNAFISSYKAEVLPLSPYSLTDAISVLESWKKSRQQENLGDYNQCGLALEQFKKIGLEGVVAYADGVPVAFSLGERICNGTMFVTMFEKAISGYKGVYQFVNRAQALNLPSSVIYINREQDLGDLGLRQAKTTYRPCSFTKKYLVLPLTLC